MHLLVCFALKEEAVLFRKIAADKPDVAIIVTGVGRKNAEKSLREFLAAHSGGASVPASRFQDTPASQARLASTLAPPDYVLSCGFAGGLNPDLKPGDVIFETSIPRSSRRESAQIENGEKSEPTHVGCYEQLLAAGAKPAKFFCADRIATTVAEKKKLRGETGADAVEMESWAIYTVCRERGIPYATVRVISDTANEDLPLDFNQLAKSDMNLHYGKLALAILKSPGKIGALLKFQKQTRFAAERLAEVLSKIQ